MVVKCSSDNIKAQNFVTKLVGDYLLNALTIQNGDLKCDKEMWEIIKTMDFK